jgi:uncharacterized membrane protein
MAALRIVLIVANALLFAFLLYLFINYAPSRINFGPWLLVGYLACFALNFIYLLLAPQKSNSRLVRLIGLWLDAKESELRQRAKPSQEGK